MITSETKRLFQSADDKYSFREVKYFHPSGSTLPNGSHYQKGGFLNECRKNMNDFVLDENVHGEQMAKYRGGLIVLAVDEDAVQTLDNRIANATKQFIESLKDHFDKDNPRNNGECIGAYSLGNFFKGKYVGDNGKMFDDRSVCMEINGLSDKSLLKLAEMIAERFKQKSVLVKDFNQDKIYLGVIC